MNTQENKDLQRLTGADSPTESHRVFPEVANLKEPTEFCSWQFYKDHIACRRCGSVCYDAGRPPTCPPWVTRTEPDGKRLPHIKTQEQNRAAYQAWIDAENYKLKTSEQPNAR